MRRSPQESGTWTLMLALVLVLCLVLFATLAPIAAAQSADEWQDDLLPVSAMMMDGESGRVTDEDGVIGNGRSGADHATDPKSHARDRMPRQAQDAASGTEGAAPMADGGTNSGGAMGALPWIIASLVVLAVVLIGLALLPKRGRSR